MKYISILISLLFICSSANASTCDSERTSNWFSKKYSVSKLSESVISISNRLAVNINKNLPPVIPLNGSFSEPPDHHASMKYKVISIEDKIVKIEYYSVFDARSFGDGISECKGVFTVAYE